MQRCLAPSLTGVIPSLSHAESDFYVCFKCLWISFEFSQRFWQYHRDMSKQYAFLRTSGIEWCHGTERPNPYQRSTLFWEKSSPTVPSSAWELSGRKIPREPKDLLEEEERWRSKTLGKMRDPEAESWSCTNFDEDGKNLVATIRYFIQKAEIKTYKERKQNFLTESHKWALKTACGSFRISFWSSQVPLDGFCGKMLFCRWWPFQCTEQTFLHALVQSSSWLEAFLGFFPKSSVAAIVFGALWLGWRSSLVVLPSKFHINQKTCQDNCLILLIRDLESNIENKVPFFTKITLRAPPQRQCSHLWRISYPSSWNRALCHPAVQIWILLITTFGMLWKKWTSTKRSRQPPYTVVEKKMKRSFSRKYWWASSAGRVQFVDWRKQTVVIAIRRSIYFDGRMYLL